MSWSEHAGAVSAWIGVGTILVGAIAGYTSLQNDVANSRDVDVGQNEAISALRDRVRALENDRGLEERIHALTVEITALKAEVRALRPQRRRR